MHMQLQLLPGAHGEQATMIHV
eukprot:COSAG02_NODE_48240_length_335_cov_0.847458_1_plen_21_part_10